MDKQLLKYKTTMQNLETVRNYISDLLGESIDPIDNKHLEYVRGLLSKKILEYYKLFE